MKETLALTLIILFQGTPTRGAPFRSDLNPTCLKDQTEALLAEGHYDRYFNTTEEELLAHTQKNFPNLAPIDEAIQKDGYDGIGGIALGIWKVKLGGKNYILKRLATSELPLVNVRKKLAVARSLHEIGLGPETFLVRRNRQIFFLSEFEKGVNIKEIIMPTDKFGTEANQKLLAKMQKTLGTTGGTLQENRKKLAQALLTHKEELRRFRKIITELENGGWQFGDFQYMVNIHPETGHLEFSIIDADNSVLKAKADLKPNHSENVLGQFRNHLRHLRERAEGREIGSLEGWDPLADGY